MIVKKLAATTPKAVTANRLGDGIVVWLARGAGWVERLAEAGVFAADESEAALARAQDDERRRVVVDPYLIDVEAGPAGPRALRYREQLRALGPSVRPDLGKQAEQLAAEAEIKEAS